MCGISVIAGNVSDKEEKLKLSLSKITHRGDHNFEYRIFDNGAVGVNRLAIVDERSGAQPQHDEHERYFVAFNGEIFNFQELGKRLEKMGHELQTNSDTEVLVHLWEAYGPSMVKELDSEMFTFVIFDKQTGEIFAVRDRIGVKPLYYGRDESNNLYIASEIKALVCFEDIKQIHELPAGHYLYKDKLVSYYQLIIGRERNISLSEFAELIEEAVRKRVQTHLPIAVFLSGGPDSSLVMELATKFHNDVTALILGTVDSPDYVNAIKLCEEKKWKYIVANPDIDYEKELSDIIYYVESYDPNIVRHSFANNIVSKLAHEHGFKIVLTGEGIDEIFAGYNEFLEMDPEKINLGCKRLLDSMPLGNLMRVDKMAMRYTVETRCPFFDQKLVDFAMSLDGSLKVGEYQSKKYTKLIFRKIAARYLPDWIAYREKAAFGNGAGMAVGINYRKGDGVLSEIANRLVTDEEFEKIKSEFHGRDFQTKEEVLLFKIYYGFGYDRFVEGRFRLMVKDTLLSL
jgi:asparagine synthase (glutamine-hydrolysing)